MQWFYYWCYLKCLVLSQIKARAAREVERLCASITHWQQRQQLRYALGARIRRISLSLSLSLTPSLSPLRLSLSSKPVLKSLPDFSSCATSWMAEWKASRAAPTLVSVFSAWCMDYCFSNISLLIHCPLDMFLFWTTSSAIWKREKERERKKNCFLWLGRTSKEKKISPKDFLKEAAEIH